jgi:serine/threonine protein kinase
MGEVYRARDTRLDRTVAIKILPDTLAEDPHFRERFDREARTISQLDDPHICALYDVGRENGTSYLVMQYLEGETLAARSLKGPLAVSEALKIGIEIAKALERAHRAGVIHRDLKPGNVMLTRSGAKLLDFGLAKATPVSTAGASVLRRARFSAPFSTWRRNRSKARRPTLAPICSRWVRCSSRWSPAGQPFKVRHRRV